MQPKTFRRREQRARATRTAVDHFTGPVLDHLRERMRAVGYEGAIPPECFAELQETLTGFVETSLEHLHSAVAERHQVQHEAPELRECREAATRELYSTLVDLRQTVRGVFGRTVEHELFGAGKTPRDAHTMVRLGHALAENLSRRETRERLSGLRRVRFDWDDTAADLADKTARVEEVVRELTVNASRQSTAVVLKDEAAEEHDRTQRGMFKVLEGLYEMAGMDHLARRLRPTEPRRRRSTASPEAPAEPEVVAAPADEVPISLPKVASGSGAVESRPEALRSASSPVEPRPELSPSASRQGIRHAGPPRAAPPPGSPSSAQVAASASPVRASSDPPGGASHPGWRRSGWVEGEIPVV